MGYLVTTATLQDCVNKVNFELGGGASDQSSRISHREASGKGREDTQKGEREGLRFSLSLRSGKCERKAAGRSSEVSFDLSGFYPNF